VAERGLFRTGRSDLTTVILHQPGHEGESQAAAVNLGGVKWLENVFHILLDSLTAIHDIDGDFFIR